MGESETNREVQDRLARLINNSGIGIRAEVTVEELWSLPFTAKLASEAAMLVLFSPKYSTLP